MFRMSEDEVEEWGDILEWATKGERDGESEEMLLMLSDVDVSEVGGEDGVGCLVRVGGSVWSLDGKLRVSQWNLEEDYTGVKKTPFEITHLRSLSLSPSPSASPPPPSPFFSPSSVRFLHVGNEDLWVLTSTFIVICHYSSFFDVEQGKNKEIEQLPDVIELAKEKEGGRIRGVEVVKKWGGGKEVWVCREGADGKGEVVVVDVSDKKVKERVDVSGTAICWFNNEVWIGTKEGEILRYNPRATKEPPKKVQKVHENEIIALSSDVGSSKRVWGNCCSHLSVFQ